MAAGLVIGNSGGTLGLSFLALRSRVPAVHCPGLCGGGILACSRRCGALSAARLVFAAVFVGI